MTVAELVDQLLSEAGLKKRFDLIADFALPVPLTIISIMMGVPESERRSFHVHMGRFLQGSLSSLSDTLTRIPAVLSMIRVFRRLIRLRREEPGEDLLTALVQAEESGDHLNDAELLSMVFILLLAGHETTVNLIGSGALALMQHRDQLERLRAHPELIEPAIEELLRFTNPVEHPGPRYATEDVLIRGVPIARGQLVIPLIASANRDEAQFPRGEELDLARDPNRHLAFGMGIHYCLGAPLARLEGQIALLELVRRFPGLHLTVPESDVQWKASIAVRGPRALPVAID